MAALSRVLATLSAALLSALSRLLLLLTRLLLIATLLAATLLTTLVSDSASCFLRGFLSLRQRQEVTKVPVVAPGRVVRGAEKEHSRRVRPPRIK